MRNAQMIPTPAVAERVRRYRRRNLVHRARGLRAEIVTRVFPILGLPSIVSELRATIIRKDGTIEEYGVISRRVVTTVAVQYFANACLNTTEMENLNYHDSGTGTNAESIADTTLQTPTGIARSAGTQTSPSNGAYRTVGTITYNNTFAITEHGVFSASSVGTLLDRSVFAALNVVSGDAIQFTYTITWAAGG